MELMKIGLGKSLFQYIYIALCIGLFFALYFLLRHKSEKIQKRVLFGFLVLNFVLHFLKLSFPQYIEKGFPGILRKCTFENICATSTIFFPFFYISKSKVLKDYMFYLGIISGIAGCIIPLPVIGIEFYQLETIRYYICHSGIWIVPLLMVILGHHKLDYRRIWKSFLMYFAVLGLIIVNEVILISLGWVNTVTMEEFLSGKLRDMGYAVGLPSSADGAAKFILWLTPKPLRHVPILWEVIPVFVFCGIITLLMCAYWEHENIKNDCIALKNKVVEIYKKLKEKRAKQSESIDESTDENTDENKDGE